jgi:hypothetical protein
MNLYDGDPRIAIPQVINAFTCYQDHRQREETLSVCTEDFQIIKEDRKYDVAGLRELWRKWDGSGMLVRHIRTGLHFTRLTETEAETIGYGLFYAVKSDGLTEYPLLDHPGHFTEYHEKFVKTAAGWKLKFRHAIDIMRRETAPLPSAKSGHSEALKT